MAGAFQRDLYRKHQAVYVSALKPNVKLLDVLIKTDTKGLWFAPVLENLGSMLKLGIQGEVYDAANKRLEESFKSFQSFLEVGAPVEGDKNLFSMDKTPTNFHFDVSTSRNLVGTLFTCLVDADLRLKKANDLTCTLHGVKTASVDKGEVLKILIEDPLQWKRDTSKKIFQWPKPGCIPSSSGRELWFVHDILYANKVVLKSRESFTAGAGEGTTEIVLVTAVGIKLNRTARGALEVSVLDQEKFMFAFRVVCINYDLAGDYVKHFLNAGSRTPIYRSHEDGPFDDPRLQLGGLFLHPPAEDSVEGGPNLERLEIVSADTVIDH